MALHVCSPLWLTLVTLVTLIVLSYFSLYEKFNTVFNSAVDILLIFYFERCGWLKYMDLPFVYHRLYIKGDSSCKLILLYQDLGSVLIWHFQWSMVVEIAPTSKLAALEFIVCSTIYFTVYHTIVYTLHSKV